MRLVKFVSPHLMPKHFLYFRQHVESLSGNTVDIDSFAHSS